MRVHDESRHDLGVESNTIGRGTNMAPVTGTHEIPAAVICVTFIEIARTRALFKNGLQNVDYRSDNLGEIGT